MRGKKISTDLKATILALGGLHSVSEIAALTTVSRRQIYRIRKSWETTRCLEPERMGRKTGRPRFLSQDEEAVSFPLSFTSYLLMTFEFSMLLKVYEEHLTFSSKTFKHKSKPI
jgi:transposase